MKIVKAKRVHSIESRAKPYSGGGMHPEIERIIEEGKQKRQEGVSSPTGEQDDDDDDGEDDDILSGGDFRTPGGYIRGSLPSPLLRSVSSDSYHPVPLGSALPPPPSGAAVAAASGDGDDDMPAVGIYDGLAKLDPNTIIDKYQLASMFRVSEKTIRRRIDAGELPPPHMRMRRQPQWFVGVLLDWLKDRARGITGPEDARRQHIRERTETEPNN